MDQQRNMPLHWAAKAIAIDAVRLLVDKKAGVEAPGKDAWTALRESLLFGSAMQSWARWFKARFVFEQWT